MNGGTSSIEQLPNEITKNNVVMSVEDKVNNSTINHMQQQGLMSQQQQGLMPQQQQGLMPQQQQGTQQPGMMEQQRSMPHQQGGQQPGLMPQQNAINTVVSGLQNMQYSTDLPNRDIPMNTNHITHDNTTRPNYVPEADPEKMDYIGEEESLQDMISDLPVALFALLKADLLQLRKNRQEIRCENVHRPHGTASPKQSCHLP